MQIKYLYALISTLKPSDLAMLYRYLQFHHMKSTDLLIKALEVIAESGKDMEKTQAKLDALGDQNLAKRLFELKNLLEAFLIEYIIPEEPYQVINRKVLLAKYLREQSLLEQSKQILKDASDMMRENSGDSHFRSLYINLLNEIRKNFYYKYYSENDYKISSMEANYLELEENKKWIDQGHQLNKIFYDFSLKAAHKIEMETLQVEGHRKFTPYYFSFTEYLQQLQDDAIPLLYKTFILDIIEGAEEVSAGKYLEATENMLDRFFDSASVVEKNNILTCLIISGKTDKYQKREYYSKLVDLKPELNPGIIHTYIIDNLDDDITEARKEFNRLKEKAVQDPKNELLAIEGILLTREKKYEEALAHLNKVIIYQQDKLYFDVNLCLIECYSQLGDNEVAQSTLSKLSVYFYKYKESLSKDLELKYKSWISKLKKK